MEIFSSCFKCMCRLSRHVNASEIINIANKTKSTVANLPVHVYIDTNRYVLKCFAITDIRIPYMLILGGTDVNENYRDPDMMDVMTQAVTKAR